jgi:hypothetical protein
MVSDRSTAPVIAWAWINSNNSAGAAARLQSQAHTSLSFQSAATLLKAGKSSPAGEIDRSAALGETAARRKEPRQGDNAASTAAVLSRAADGESKKTSEAGAMLPGAKGLKRKEPMQGELLPSRVSGSSLAIAGDTKKTSEAATMLQSTGTVG